MRDGVQLFFCSGSNSEPKSIVANRKLCFREGGRTIIFCAAFNAIWGPRGEHKCERGQGFYRTRVGKITPEFKHAFAENELRAYYGDDASVQPGNLQDVLLHKAAVSWIRRRETRTRPEEPWKESPQDLGVRLRSIAQDMNKNCNVEGPCRQLPRRLIDLADREGDRLGT